MRRPHHLRIGARVPRRPFRGLHWVGRFVLWLGGWRLDIEFPDEPKLVLIAAPHTSNWDMVWGMAAIFTMQVDLRWFAKHTLFQGIWGRIFRAAGGIPIDRGAAGGVVRQTARAFAAEPQLVIALTPEGTRSRVTQWKRGFYNIALAADVPVLVVWMDFARREIGARHGFRATGDWAADMRPVFEFYRTVTPHTPANFAVEGD